MCQPHLPNKFWMVDPVRPLCLGTVIWFGSLEFMSLGCEYDMVLLTHRFPQTDDDITYQQPRHRRRPGCRSHRARQAQREQDHLDTAQAQGDAPRSAGVDSLGGGGAELDDEALPRATDVFPLPRLKLDRSPARDSVPTAGYGILAERGASP